MTWSVTGGDYRTGYRWHMDWTATIPAASRQSITFTAVDTRNNTRKGQAYLKPVQTVTAGVPFGRPYNSPFSVR